MLRRIILALIFMIFVWPVYINAEEKLSPKAKAEMGVSNQRDEAIRKGYEKELDRAIDESGGTRTKEVITESERIRHGGGQGQGHQGETAQPGLDGKEGGPK